MVKLLEIIFSEFKNIPYDLLVKEIIAVVTGIISIISAKKENILVFPFGILSTTIYTYIYWQDKLWGNMLIHVYYTVFSIYGWILWAQKVNKPTLNVTKANKKDYLLGGIVFLVVFFFVAFLHRFYPNIIDTQLIYIDILTPSIFCVAMIFMAYKKIENWILWIIGDILVIPLYYKSHLYFTSLLYSIYIIIGISAYWQWKKQIIQKS